MAGEAQPEAALVATSEVAGKARQMEEGGGEEKKKKGKEKNIKILKKY